MTTNQDERNVLEPREELAQIEEEILEIEQTAQKNKTHLSFAAREKLDQLLCRRSELLAAGLEKSPDSPIDQLVFPRITWYCDKCNAHLNEQPGFTDRYGFWRCTKCGFKNKTTQENII